MNFKKCLAVVLSMTLLLTCLISGMSLNTSAAQAEAEAAAFNTLKAAWSAMSTEPEVIAGNFFINTGTQSSANWGSVDIANISEDTMEDGQAIQYYDFKYSNATINFIISKTSSYSGQSQIDIDDYNDIYMYIKNTELDGGAGMYAASSKSGTANSETAAKSDEWQQVSFMTNLLNANSSEEQKGNYDGTNGTIRRFHVSQASKNTSYVSFSQIYGLKKAAAPTNVTTLKEMLDAVDAADFSSYIDNAAKENFFKEVKAAKKVYYSNPDNAKTEIITAWSNLSAKRVALIADFNLKINGSWSKQENTLTTTVSGEEITYYDYTYDQDTAQSIIFANGNYNPTNSKININDYSAIYVWVKNPNTQAFNFKPVGTVSYANKSESYTTVAKNTNNWTKVDLLPKLQTASNGFAEGEYLKRLDHSNPDRCVNTTSFSQIYAVPKFDKATAFADAFPNGTANADWDVKDWVNAYHKYDFSAYSGAEKLAEVIDNVTGACLEFSIYQDGVYRKDGKHFYDNHDGTLATGFRTFAKYTCPVNEKGFADTTKIIVNGTTYDIKSRSLMMARSDDGTFGALNTTTAGGAIVTVTEPKDLAKFWSVVDNGDGTAEVTFSFVLRGISQTNAENKYYQSRALIEYEDEAGNPYKAYSAVANHGTVKSIYDAVGTGDWFATV